MLHASRWRNGVVFSDESGHDIIIIIIIIIIYILTKSWKESNSVSWNKKKMITNVAADVRHFGIVQYFGLQYNTINYLFVYNFPLSVSSGFLDFPDFWSPCR